MHIVLVGCGRVGTELAVELDNQGHSVAVIDKNKSAFANLPKRWTGRAVLGYGFDRDHLEQAGIQEADAFGAVTRGDNTNIVSARVAKEHYGIQNVVVRIYDPRRALIFERLGIPTVASVRWATDQALRRLFPEARHTDWVDATGGMALIEYELPTELVGLSMDPLMQNESVRLIGVTRAGQVRMSSPAQIAQEGDLLHLAIRRELYEELDAQVSNIFEEQLVRVAIAGAGNVGTFIARDLLSAGHEILLIEQNGDIITKNEPTLDATWIQADACEVASLAEAHLEKADVFVAATGDDEDNLVMALLAKQEFAVPRVIARVNHPKNEWLFNESWGVDVSVSTPHLLSALVEEAVSVGSLVRLLQFDRGATRLVEVTLAETSPVAGQTLNEITLPRGGSVVAVIRNDHVTVPRGDTELLPGDEVIVLVSAESEEAIKAVFIRDTQS